MSSEIPEKKSELEHGGHVDVLHDEVLANAELMNDAVDGENLEHDQTVWEAAKTHPWACLWAFVMCFTIVSSPVREPRTRMTAQALFHPGQQLMPT